MQSEDNLSVSLWDNLLKINETLDQMLEVNEIGFISEIGHGSLYDALCEDLANFSVTELCRFNEFLEKKRFLILRAFVEQNNRVNEIEVIK